MDHFLITRFNIKVGDWNTTRSGMEVNNTDWLVHRFELFEKYCLPSVMNQSNQDFVWLIFFDTSTPDYFLNKIGRLKNDYQNLKPVFIDGIRQFIPELVRQIKNHGKSDHVITSRVDNDDLLHRDFIKTIKYLGLPSDQLIIDLQRGYQMTEVDAILEIRNYSHQFNPFISLVESRKDFQTVMNKNHRDWKKALNIKIFNKRPLWVELIHDRNKLNSIRDNLTMVFKIDLSDFGLTEHLRLHSPFFIALNNMKIKMKRVLVKAKRKFTVSTF